MFLEAFGDINQTAIFYVFAAVCALNVILALFVVIIGCFIRSRLPGSSIDFYVAFGGLALEVCVLLRGLQMDWASLEVMNAVCQVYPALLVFGLIWFIGGLLIKASALFHFYRLGGEKPMNTEWQPNLWLLILMIIDVVIVLVWTLKYQPTLLKSIQAVDLYECAGPKDKEFEILVAVYHGILLVLAALLIWPAVHYTRRLPTSFESSLLAVIVYNTLFVAIAATLAFFFAGKVKLLEKYETDPNIQYAVNGGLISFAVFVALLLLLIGKVVAARRPDASGEEEYDQVNSVKDFD